MKLIVTILFFTAMAATSAVAQIVDTIFVGPRTVNLAVAPDGFILALSEGRDLDFNEMLDESAGEVPATLYRIDPSNNAVTHQWRLPDFARSLALTSEHGYILRTQPLRISQFDPLTLAISADSLILGNAIAELSFYSSLLSGNSESNTITVSTGGFDGDGAVVGFDENGVLQFRAITGTGSSSVLFDEVAATQSQAALVLNQGTFGAGNSTLSYLNIQPQIFKTVTGRNLGSTGNAMTLGDDGLLYLVMNGSHTIEVFNPSTLQALGSVPTGTSGFDGPRQVALLPDGGTGVVSTFSNDVRFFDLQTLQVTTILPVGQKPEEMAVFRNSLYVANGGFTGAAEDSTIFVIDWRQRAIIDTIVTGIRTTRVILGPDSMLYALSEGRDLDFDGALQVENGEVPGKIFRIDPLSNSIVATLTLASFAEGLAVSLPPRDFSPPELTSVYCIQREPERLSRFDALTLTTVRDTLMLADPAAGLNFRGLGWEEHTRQLLVTTGGFAEPGGELLLITPANGNITHRFRTGIGAADATALDSPKVPGGRRWFVLNEGFFGSATATLSMIEFSPEVFKPVAGIKLGDTANDGALLDHQLHIAVSGNHSIEIIDVKEWRYLGNVPVGTQGFDGPRQIAFLNATTGLVTTYSNDVRSFDLASHSIGRINATGSKPEDIVVAGDRVFVANGGFTGFAEDSTIFVYRDTALPVDSPAISAPALFTLEQSYPNPFAPATHAEPLTLAFVLEQQAHATLEIFNVLGQRVATIADELLPAGHHVRHWQGRDTTGRRLSSGIYYYRLKAAGRMQVRQIMLQR